VKPLAVVYSKEARRDLHSIFDYIQLFRPSAAENFIDAVDRTIRRIAALPRSGSQARDKKLRKKGYRYIVVDEYLLFYRYSKGSLTILRLVHGRRHYVPLLLS
jgi:toxin ParE1/3/4